jgi:hypothetical protein
MRTNRKPGGEEEGDDEGEEEGVVDAAANKDAIPLRECDVSEISRLLKASIEWGGMVVSRLAQTEIPIGNQRRSRLCVQMRPSASAAAQKKSQR